MVRLRLVVLVFVCLSTLTFAADKKPAETLSTEIGRILDQPDIARGFWGIEVVSLSSGQTLYSFN
ncbi:MAG TPA: hypothetical protein VKB56_10940, partial [Terriglobales bacterium]|nr:hypothetical protein [Terriglobales bacterium]